MNKKRIIIILGVIIGLVIAGIVAYTVSLSPTSDIDEEVVFTVEARQGKSKILDNLKEANLIKSKYGAIIYMYLNGHTNMQAGKYKLTRNMGTKEIINIITNGEIIDTKRATKMITFREGLTIKDYMKLLADNTNLKYEEIIEQVNDKELLKSLITDYWFLTDDILDDKIYFGLEGYLFPSRYDFYVDTDLKTAIKTILNNTDKVLSKYKEDINKSKYNIHELLTISSIIEKEANSYEDRTKVSQVIYKRLDTNMNLGMDVTSYYGVQKSMKEVLTAKDLNDENPYNTRVKTFLGLPKGAICNPGEESIKASLNPSNTDYIYFFADVTTGKVYFTSDYNEFLSFKKLYG